MAREITITSIRTLSIDKEVNEWEVSFRVIGTTGTANIKRVTYEINGTIEWPEAPHISEILNFLELYILE